MRRLSIVAEGSAQLDVELVEEGLLHRCDLEEVLFLLLFLALVDQLDGFLGVLVGEVRVELHDGPPEPVLGESLRLVDHVVGDELEEVLVILDLLPEHGLVKLRNLVSPSHADLRQIVRQLFSSEKLAHEPLVTNVSWWHVLSLQTGNQFTYQAIWGCSGPGRF